MRCWLVKKHIDKIIQVLTYEVVKAHISNLVIWAEDGGVTGSYAYKAGHLAGLQQAMAAP